ncbi:MAG: hypothetical protein AB1555_06095 [Nitrospirota bacterium]
MRAFITAISLSIITACSGCATLSGGQDQYFVCSYDLVWETALESVKDRPITVQDKDKGLIETGWVEMKGKDRPYGIFGREGFGNRERARMTLALKKQDDVTAVNVLETRQRWHARGGVTQQATKWWPIEPSVEAMTAALTRLNTKLQEKGCSPT